MYINIYLAVGAFLLLLGSCGQGKNSEAKSKNSVAVQVFVDSVAQRELKGTIDQFVAAYVFRDNRIVNSLIHPKKGIMIIYRPGVADTFVHVDRLDFSKPTPDYYPYPAISNEYVLKFEGLPAFDCGTEKWNKLGLLCDTLSHPNQVSSIIAFEKEFDETKYTEEQLEATTRDESQSFRVILTGENPLIFHVQKLDGRWYVTTLDRAYGGCDA